MSQKEILKSERDFLRNMESITIENLNKLSEILEKNVAPKKVWNEINSSLRQKPQIHEIFYKVLNKNNLKAIIEMFETEGIGTDGLFTYIRDKNEDLLQFCVKFNRMPFKELLYTLRERPELAELLQAKAPIKELVEEYPEITQYISQKVFIPNTESLGEDIISETAFWKRDGKPIQHFSLGSDIEFKGREDYLKFIRAYIKEDDSIPKFCDKYLIENIKGFSGVVSTLEGEDKELQKQIQEVKKHATDRYLAAMKDVISQIVEGKTTIQEKRKTWPRLRAYDFIHAKDYLDEDTYVALIEKMIDELGIRDGECKKNKKDENGVEYSYFGNIPYEELIKWFSYEGNDNPGEDVSKGIKKIMVPKFYRGSNYNDRKYLSNQEELFRICKSFEKLVNIDECLECSFENANGEYIHTTKEMIQDAEEYMKATERYVCQKNMLSTLRAITKGILTKEKIEEVVQMKSEQQEKNRESKFAKVKNASNISEYIQAINKEQERDSKSEDLGVNNENTNEGIRTLEVQIEELEQSCKSDEELLEKLKTITIDPNIENELYILQMQRCVAELQKVYNRISRRSSEINSIQSNLPKTKNEENRTNSEINQIGEL